MKSTKYLLLLLLAICGFSLNGQTRTIGLFINDTAKVHKGYTLFAPKQNTMTYLINNEGRIINKWTKSIYPPGQSVYLLENGNLLRTCMTQSSLGTGGGEGGRIEEYSWNDSLVWYMNYSTTTYMQHHDIRRLPNGNILMLVVEKKTMTEILAAGFDSSKFQADIKQKNMMLPDCIIEIQPTRPSGGTVVWEWHTWDHLIQDFDATKLNYGSVAAHPELIDCDGDRRILPLFWNHMNSIDYNPALDQIVVSVRGNSELWVIDHGTTTAQAKGHTGGRRGKGGDLLYRWGNPLTYMQGTVSTQMYREQHDVEWVRPDCPGAGNFTCFNNGVGRNYSTIDEITPPIDTAGNYRYVSGQPFGPSALTWQYTATPPADLFAHDISGAQRLQNGNTIICSGPHGNLLEVTANKEVVWKYINPVTNTGPLRQGDSVPSNPVRPEEGMNSVFRVYKYPYTYAAFTGRTLTPGNFIELYPTNVSDKTYNPETYSLKQNYPNPFNPETTIEYYAPAAGKVEISLWSPLGEMLKTLVNEEVSAGIHTVSLNATGLNSGVYFYTLKAADYFNVKKLSVLK